MTIAIVVGIDGLGKTPLIELMKEVNPSIEVRKPIPAKNPELSLNMSLLEALKESRTWTPYLQDNRLLIYDRFPYPDAFVYDKYSSPDWDLIGRWDDLLLLHGVVLVYVQPWNRLVYLMTKAKDPDEHFDTHEDKVFDEIISRYEQILGNTSLKVIKVTTIPYGQFSRKDAEEVLFEIRLRK